MNKDQYNECFEYKGNAMYINARGITVKKIPLEQIYDYVENKNLNVDDKNQMVDVESWVDNNWDEITAIAFNTLY